LLLAAITCTWSVQVPTVAWHHPDPLHDAPAGAERSFVTFILEPLYKLTATVVGEHPKTIERVLGEEFGVYLKSSSYSMDVKPLLKEVKGAAGQEGEEGAAVHVLVLAGAD
jgi:hypothetical protein